MSEERPSAAEAMYGPDGPVSDGPNFGRQREMIESGIARPDPRFADEEARPSPIDNRQARSGPAFDTARVPVSFDADPQMLRSFGTAARSMGLSQSQGQQLLDMHQEAMKGQTAALERQWQGWWETSHRELGGERGVQETVNTIKSAVDSAVGSGSRDAAEFYRALEWSGLAFNPSVLKVLSRLAGGRRY